MPLTATPLIGNHLCLEPLEESHREPLRHAAADPRIWRFTHIRLLDSDYDPFFDSMLAEQASGSRAMYTVVRIADGQVIGSTSFFDYHEKHRRIEVGSTWYRPEYWATAVNPESKLLMLGHAFEAMKLNRVTLVTDLLNTRSQAAIAKLGAKREGVLRSHMVTQGGRIRDTVVFSIIAEEWPEVREGLKRRLDK